MIQGHINKQRKHQNNWQFCWLASEKDMNTEHVLWKAALKVKQLAYTRMQ